MEKVYTFAMAWEMYSLEKSYMFHASPAVAMKCVHTVRKTSQKKIYDLMHISMDHFAVQIEMIQKK